MVNFSHERFTVTNLWVVFCPCPLVFEILTRCFIEHLLCIWYEYLLIARFWIRREGTEKSCSLYFLMYKMEILPLSQDFEDPKCCCGSWLDSVKGEPLLPIPRILLDSEHAASSSPGPCRHRLGVQQFSLTLTLPTWRQIVRLRAQSHQTALPHPLEFQVRAVSPQVAHNFCMTWLKMGPPTALSSDSVICWAVHRTRENSLLTRLLVY